ncbi:hypothetical protein [Streptomyces spectabilis]|uniref:Uncharacterized protein n=1 Tax=Streptomyces spectabilis TaxID=68270 RepID=A0A516RF79_STRST|nr:hypothetical protein [Streptomyces spectabilis]QDQ14301.1 hypothetical protein FH965_30105 [Streptomyces spectabilis]
MKIRRNAFADQVRVTGEVSTLSPAPRKRNRLGRSQTSRVVSTNHLDALRPDIRATVERIAAQRGIRIADIVVKSPTHAIMP